MQKREILLRFLFFLKFSLFAFLCSLPRFKLLHQPVYKFLVLLAQPFVNAAKLHISLYHLFDLYPVFRDQPYIRQL